MVTWHDTGTIEPHAGTITLHPCPGRPLENRLNQPARIIVTHLLAMICVNRLRLLYKGSA